MVFDDNTLLARYNKRAAEAGGSRAQPRSKRARTSSDSAGGDPISPSLNAPGPLQKNKEPVSASRPTKASGSQARHESSAPSGEVGGPTSARTAPPRPASGSPPSSGAPPLPSLARSRPSSSSKTHPPSSPSAYPPSSSAARPSSSSGAYPPGAYPPSSARVEIGSGDELYDPEWFLLATDSALEDGKVAREIVRGASLPFDRALLEAGAFSEFVDQTYCSAVRHLHEVDMMAEAVSSMRARAKASDDKLQASKKDLGKAQKQLKEAEERAKKAESELGDTQKRLHQKESELGLSQSNLRTSEARSTGFASELEGRRHENNLLKLKLQQAEEREKEAVERARTAVETFRQSTEYQDELAEEAVDGLIRGFEDFRKQVTRKYPKVNFRLFRPRLGSEDDQDLRWVEELEDVPLEVVPPSLPEVTPEVASEVASEGVGNPTSEVATAAAAEVATAAAPEVATEAAADPVSPITNVGDRN